MRMTEYALHLVAKHESGNQPLSGRWVRKESHGEHQVEVRSDNGLGELLVLFPDGKLRARTKQWFLAEYERKV